MTARLSPRFALWRAGAFFGILAAVCIIVFVPAGLREAGFHVAKAWGLDQWAAPLCLLGAVPGAVVADRLRAVRSP
jgi:hypothetical protein